MVHNLLSCGIVQLRKQKLAQNFGLEYTRVCGYQMEQTVPKRAQPSGITRNISPHAEMPIPRQAGQSMQGKSLTDHCCKSKGSQVKVLDEQPIPVHFSHRGRRKTTRLKDEDLSPAKKPSRDNSKQRTWQTIPRFQRARECSLEVEEQQKSPTLERPEMKEALRRERYPSVVKMATPVSQPVKRAGQQSTLTEMEIPEVVVLDIEEDTELEAQVARSP